MNQSIKLAKQVCDDNVKQMDRSMDFSGNVQSNGFKTNLIINYWYIFKMVQGLFVLWLGGQFDTSLDVVMV